MFHLRNDKNIKAVSCNRNRNSSWTYISIYINALQKKTSLAELISIDLPSTPETGPSNNDGYDDVLPIGQSPGWVVPDYLRPFWKLILVIHLKSLLKYYKKLLKLIFLFMIVTIHVR